MAKTYTRLPLALGSWQSNFIAIPTEFARAVRASPECANQGVVAFRLNWTGLKDGSTTETEVKECYVGWNGAVARGSYLQVPEAIGEKTGLSEALNESKARGGSGLIVNVYALRSCPIAQRVDVEPVLYEDWETLEKHAGFVETQMLSQICVLYQNQSFTVWVANVPVNLVVKGGVTGPCVKLANDTEVVVAPKPRPDGPRAIAKEKESTPDALLTSGTPAILRVQSVETSKDDWYNGVALVNPATVALLRNMAGWDVAGEDSLGLSQEAQAVSTMNPKQLISCSVLALEEGLGEESIVLSLRISESVANGHVAISRATRRNNIRPFTRVKLVPLPFDPAKVEKVSTQINIRRLVLPNSLIPSFVDSEQVTKSIKDAISTEYTVLSNGSWISSDAGLFKVVQPMRHVMLTDETLESVNWLLGEDLNVAYQVNASANEEKRNEDEEIEDADMREWEEDQGPWTLETLGGPAKKAGEELKAHFAPLLNSRVALARARLGTEAVGGAYLYGPRGSGKSTLVRALGRSLGMDASFLTCVVPVDCASLKGGKRSAIQKRFERAFALAAARAPSLVVFEDLDALLPHPNSPQDEDAQIVWLSEFLEGQITEARGKQSRFERAVAESIKQGNLSSHSDVPLWTKHAIGFLATGRQRKSLRSALTRLGLFEKRVEMPTLDAPGRKDVLGSICSLRNLPVDHNELETLALKTEGFTCADLEILVERAIHVRAGEALDQQQQQRANGKDIEKLEGVEVVLHDPLPAVKLESGGALSRALEGYTPSSLRGVKLAKSETVWADVGGLSSVRDVLKETLELPFQFAELYDRSPQRLASGILLYGPPGCGKTLLAGAVASECGLNFISVKGPEVLNKYIGASEQAIRDLFARAASVTPCIVFFDEFDAVAPRRGSDSTGVTDRVVNQLLTFLDGVESRKGVYVMAATSRPDLVDPALLRPGRLDKQLFCGFPDEAERLSILQAVSRKLRMPAEVRERTLPEMARIGKELTGADLQALCATAQLLAVHEDATEVTEDHLMRALSDTRSSVSKEDRAKFERIYRQFRGDREPPASSQNDGVMVFSEDVKQKVALM